ncbi:MAG: AbrB/MazE/SpoVT family DNA-binding domain-containing protein [Rubrobacteraceae bacterium]
MQKATITSKGQLTIPKQVRDRLGLKPGDRLAFDLDGDDILLRVEKRRALEKLRGSLPAGRSYPGREAEREAARRHVTREALGEEAS